jgi:hypothetical protein
MCLFRARRLGGTRILEALRVVVVGFHTNEGWCAFCAARVRFTTALAVERLGWAVGGDVAVGLRVLAGCRWGGGGEGEGCGGGD